VKKYWAAFNAVGGVGPVGFRRLLDYFGDLERAWHADSQELAACGMERAAAAAVVQQRSAIDPDSLMERVERAGGSVLTSQDPDYPRRLREIDEPPPVLYVRGRITPADEWAVAVVGTRRASPYGHQVAERFGTALAHSHVTVVSGMALGIDGRAHQSALAAGGRTIAVLGSGIDVIYPPQHARLAEAIAENGAVVSEYPPGTPPLAKNFPYRNRVISGLSLGVLIVEGAMTSGARFTADFAADQGREVFAVPGSILSHLSALPNRLLQEGARLATGADDILAELKLTLVPQQLEMRAVLPEDGTEADLLRLLSAEPRHIDEIARASGMPIATVSSSLTMMELKGLVRQVGGMSYVSAG
jgi:DNA processing protein